MFLIFLYCRCKEEITKASGSEIAYVPAPCGRLNSVIKCNHPLTGLGLWLNQNRMQVKRKQTKKSQKKRQMKSYTTGAKRYWMAWSVKHEAKKNEGIAS